MMAEEGAAAVSAALEEETPAAAAPREAGKEMPGTKSGDE
jgi:hypothetical protein